ncbi:amidohydrolase (plasmid) [Paroceanicella profunda]|uniref:Amidohydrolase n=1 Tax=Paroceanicella profunda TaxID=2579971 RepID=A0A5B8G204_9RHOB|nr:amidohydrolase [Paroceanicella profunda]QDL93920.1 amidohydrolase [Paroceanicella profunda]
MGETADIIITNGILITMDESRPRAEALAIAGGRIVAVGDAEGIAPLAGPRTRVVDARGATVLPGFNEAHIHIFPGSVALDQLSLAGVTGEAALRAQVRARDAAAPGPGLLIGKSCDYTILGTERSLDRGLLDEILPDRPLLLVAPDHHTAWANTAALTAAGLLHGRALPAGNEIVMGADGLATGELRENAAFGPVEAIGPTGGREGAGLVTGRDPEPAPGTAEREADLAALRKGLAHLASHGITSFQNMDGNPYQLDLLSELERRGELLCRARVPFHFVPEMPLSALDTASEMAARHGSPRLSSGTVKLFIDGVLDGWTALMAEPYADRPDWCGEPRFEEERFHAIIAEADRRGLQVAVHAIGDRAVNMVLDGYEKARAANGPRDSRHRVEHIEVALASDIPRFAELGVIASVQPPHPPGQAGLPLEPTLSRIGKPRWPLAYPWAALRAAGAGMLFASDWPVSPVDPLAGVAAAMTRPKWDADQPDNRQTLMQALEGYTLAGAKAEFREHEKGRLAPGFLADIVVLDDDLEAADPEEFPEIRPVLTICDGAVTFEDEDAF